MKIDKSKLNAISQELKDQGINEDQFISEVKEYSSSPKQVVTFEQAVNECYEDEACLMVLFARLDPDDLD